MVILRQGPPLPQAHQYVCQHWSAVSWGLQPTPETGDPQMADVSPLRRQMIEDMTVRNLSPATQRSYVHAVAKFSRFFGRSPDRLGLDDVRAFQLHLVGRGISWAGLNQIVCALPPVRAASCCRSACSPAASVRCSFSI